MPTRLAERPPLVPDSKTGEGVLRPKKKRGPKQKPIVELNRPGIAGGPNS